MKQALPRSDTSKTTASEKKIVEIFKKILKCFRLCKKKKVENV